MVKLVQTPRDLPYGGNMKLLLLNTIFPVAGYSITRLFSSKSDGSVARVPDSLTNVFYTRNGREVRDGGGITPDITVPQEVGSRIAYYLMAENIIFDYVTDWAQNHEKISAPDQFELSDTDYDSFKNYVKTRNFEYDKMSQRSLNQLKSIMEFEGYLNIAAEEFKALEAKLHPDIDRTLNYLKI